MTQKQDAQNWITFMRDAAIHPIANGTEAAGQVNEWRDEGIRLRAEMERLNAILSDPYAVYLNMLRGDIATPLEMVHLRAENERLQKEVDAKDKFVTEAISFYSEMGLLRAENKRLREAIDDAIRFIDIDRRSDAYNLLCDVLQKP
jgi:hypothetical protein